MASLRTVLDQCDESLRNALNAAAGSCASQGHYYLQIEDLLLTVLQGAEGDLTRRLKNCGVHIPQLIYHLEHSLSLRRTGQTGLPEFSPSLRKLLEKGAAIACATSSTQRVSSRVLMLILLTDDEFAPVLRTSGERRKIRQDELCRNFDAVCPERVHEQRGPDAFTRCIRLAVVLYAIAGTAYIFYSLVTETGPTYYLIRMLEPIADWGFLSQRLAFIILLGTPLLALYLSMDLGLRLARRFLPSVAQPIDTWGLRSVSRRPSIPSWSSILKLTSALVMGFGLVTFIVFWTNESAHTRKIYEVDLTYSDAKVPRAAKYVRLTALPARPYRIVYRSEDGSSRRMIVPIGGKRLMPGETIRYFFVANEEEPDWFRDTGPVRFSGEVSGASRDIEHTAMKRYKSLGFNIDSGYVVLHSKDLPAGDLAPASYDRTITSIGLGSVLTFVALVTRVRERFTRNSERTAKRTSVSNA